MQTWHLSTCRLTRVRVSAVIRPSQPARSISRSWQLRRPVLATSSAPSSFSSRSRARTTRALACLRGTPRTAARSAPCRPCRSSSSITSRSAGLSPSRVARTSQRSSARSESSSGSVMSTAWSPAWLGPGQPAVALVARHRVQPGTQPARIAQAAEPGGGDDIGVLDGARRAGRIVQHPAAVTMQRLRVHVVGPGQPGGVARHDGRDDLAVVHGIHRSWNRWHTVGFAGNMPISDPIRAAGACRRVSCTWRPAQPAARNRAPAGGTGSRPARWSPSRVPT